MEVLPTLREKGDYSLTVSNKEISKSEKSIKVGGINGLVRTLNSIMKEEGLPAWKRAEVLKDIMEQYGLDIPDDFVNKPIYMQLSFTIPMGE